MVVGNAISRGNPELEAVLERRLRYCSMPEAIREFFLWDSHPVVIAGTHGKTTTTSLDRLAADQRPAGSDGAHRRRGAGLWRRPGRAIGSGRGPHFVIEGDEYDSAFFDKTAKFLKYLPEVAVVNNVEFDHADIYADLDAVLLAFRRLVRLVPRNGLVLLGADSPHAAGLRDAVIGPVETFGLAADADWRAHDVAHRDGRTHFDGARTGGSPFGELRVAAAGRCTTCATRWRRSPSAPAPG